MRIGIDLRSMEGGAQHRGIGRYATSLIETISRLDHQNEYVFMLSGKNAKKPVFKLDKSFKYSYVTGPGGGLRTVKYIRIVYLLPKPMPVDKYGLDVVLQLDLTQRIKSRHTAIVSVIYDLIPFLYKEQYQHVHFGGYSPGRLIGYTRMRLRWKALENQIQLYKKHHKVISISERSKQDLVKWVPALRPENVAVIMLAAGELPAAAKTTPADLKTHSLDQFLFYVGGADPRKGLIELVDSMEEVWKQYPNLQLVLAGKDILSPDAWDAINLRDKISKSTRPDRIITPGFISDADLAWLYANAMAFVFPSRYEGFGLPVLEAMQAGCPVVAYDNSSIPEVAGDAALLVPDGQTMVPAIKKVIEDKELRQALIKKGKQRADQFTWEKTAKETLAVLEEVAG
jgi:glycosyltransferase involved in cell wall biosynthesis